MRHYRVMVLMVVLVCALIPISDAQVITSLTPNSSTPGKTLDVIVRGLNTHFQNGTSVAHFGQGITVKKFYVSNPVTATATIQIDNAAFTGFRSVRVQTGNEIATIDNEFEVFSDIGSFRANIELLPVETISLSDLDLTVPQNSPILFFVNIYNDNTPRRLKIYVSLSSQLRGFIGKMGMPFQTFSPNSYKRYSNRNFTSVELNGATGNEFLNIVKKLGTFPPDDYKYKLEVADETGNIIATDEDVNVVTNLRANPELILPGAPFDMPVEQVYSPFPLFQWFGQVNLYDLTLYELRDGQTPEEAVRNIAVFQKKDIAVISFLYPNYAEKLIDGKTYAWQVLGKIISSKGTQYIPSEVFRFVYMKTGGTTTDKRISKIEIVPQAISIMINEQVQFHATFYDEDGMVLPGITQLWNVTPVRGKITQNGLYTAGAEPGTVAVVVKAGSNNASEFAVVKVQSNRPAESGEWMIRAMIRQLLGITEE